VRDTHLAKRFYDMAAETSPDALWPVMLCRTHLQVVMGVQQLVERTDAFSLEFTQKYGPKYGIWLPGRARAACVLVLLLPCLRADR
jgi:hypothetical protein